MAPYTNNRTIYFCKNELTSQKIEFKDRDQSSGPKVDVTFTTDQNDKAGADAINDLKINMKGKIKEECIKNYFDAAFFN